MWGFVTVLNDILVPHLKAVFELNYTQIMLIQFTFYSLLNDAVYKAKTEYCL